VEEIKQNPNSVTGEYLSGRKKIEVPKKEENPMGNGWKL